MKKKKKNRYKMSLVRGAPAEKPADTTPSYRLINPFPVKPAQMYQTTHSLTPGKRKDIAIHK